MWALRITMPGASDDEIVRALLAATEVFERVSVTPYQASHGMDRLEAWDDRGLKEHDRKLRKKDSWRAGLWLHAEEAGIASLSKVYPPDEVIRKFDMQLIDMADWAPDRATAVEALRSIANADCDFDRNMRRVAALCEQLTDQLTDDFAARDLMADVTIAHTSLSLAKFDHGRPVGPLRQAMLAAIDRLEIATAPATQTSCAAA